MNSTLAPIRSTRKAKNGPNELIYRIPPEITMLADTGIPETLDKLGLRLEATTSAVLGSRPLERNSVIMYEKHIRGLKFFFSLIGDYESLLMLLPTPPAKVCPSMNAKSIALFIKYKRQTEGKILRDMDGHAVLDVLGREIKSDGNWKAPTNVDQFLSAVGAVHSAKGNEGPYRPSGKLLCFQSTKKYAAHKWQHSILV